jgi:DNA-binding NarL/FixJ family response regulator
VRRRNGANGGDLESRPLRVLLVNDHALLREGLTRLLADSPATEVVGEVGSVREAVAVVRSVQPDVIIAEGELNDGGAADVARILRDTHPGVNVIMLCIGDDVSDLAAAIAAGIKGVLDKSADAAGLVGCMRSVTLGQFSISDRLAARMVAGLAAMSERTAHLQGHNGVLTERELEILDLIVAGLTNRAIAERLFLSESTIRAHIRSIMQKLNVENRVQAATFALRNNLASASALSPALVGSPQS